MKSMKVVKKKIVSLDIGDKNIKVALGKANKDHLTIYKTFMFDTPTRSVEDGRIININALVASIGAELAERKIKNIHMNISFNSSEIIERELTLPVVKPNDMKEMIHYEIQQYLPIDIERYVIQYKIIEELEEEKRNYYRVMVTTIERAIIESYLSLINQLGFKPYRFDVQTNALDKFCWLICGKHEDFSQKTIAVVDIGHRLTNVSIFDKGKLNMSQAISYGGHNKDIMLEQRTGLDRKVAINMKENIKDIGYVDEYDEAGKTIQKAILDSTNEGIREIQAILKYYLSRTAGHNIDEMIIYGGSAHMGGIVQYFSEAFNFKVQSVNEVSAVKEKFTDIDISIYLNAIGAIISRK